MEILNLKRKHESLSEENDAFLGKFLTLNDVDHYVDGNENCKGIYKGKTKFVFLKSIIPKEINIEYYKTAVLGKSIKKTGLRRIALGLKNVKNKEEPTLSSIIGFFGRSRIYNYCRKSIWSLENPKKYNKCVAYAEFVDDIYKEYCLEEWTTQRKIIDKISPDFKIGKSSYTTITINQNFKTAGHRDDGNLKIGLAAMSYIAKGVVTGGGFVLPNYGVAFKLKTGDLIIIDNNEIHGNLPFKILKGSKRITNVFYCRENIKFCGTIEQETKRAQRDKGDFIIGSLSEDLNQGQFLLE